MKEVWKDIEGFEGLYQVSNLGRVRSMDRIVVTSTGKRFFKGKILKPILFTFKYGTQYYKVALTKPGKTKMDFIHRLVGKAFVPNPDNKPQISHIDDNGLNNVYTNLLWATVKENINNGKHNEKVKKSNSKQPVLMCLTDGTVVEEYASQKECERKTGIKQNKISRAIKHYRQIGDYIFKNKGD